MQEYVFTQLQPGDGAAVTMAAQAVGYMEMNAHSLEEKGQNKTQCELCAIELSHCCPALHTSSGPKLCLAENETPREMLEYDEKVTVAISFFLIRRITRLGIGTYRTLWEGKRDREQERESR